MISLEQLSKSYLYRVCCNAINDKQSAISRAEEAEQDAKQANDANRKLRRQLNEAQHEIAKLRLYVDEDPTIMLSRVVSNPR